MATMTLKEALDHAAKCKEDGVISTSGKALVVLAEKLKKMQKLVEEGASLGDFAYYMKDGN